MFWKTKNYAIEICGPRKMGFSDFMFFEFRMSIEREEPETHHGKIFNVFFMVLDFRLIEINLEFLRKKGNK